jgi:hypothetical protein
MDLFVLVAGPDDRSAIEGMLAKHRRLGIPRIQSEVRARAGWHDAEVLRLCHDFLRSQQELPLSRSWCLTERAAVESSPERQLKKR